jgi:hypothetical protein
MQINWKQLYEDLDYDRQGSWRALGQELGIPPATFTRLKAGRALSARNLLTILNGLGWNWEMYTYDR